jgi:hypothetical protein
MSMISSRRVPVKPTRVSPRTPAPFGHGLHPVPPIPDVPAMPRRIRWTALDLAPLDESDAAWDRRAGEAAVQGHYEAGMIGHELADEISRTSLVGHPA